MAYVYERRVLALAGTLCAFATSVCLADVSPPTASPPTGNPAQSICAAQLERARHQLLRTIDPQLANLRVEWDPPSVTLTNLKFDDGTEMDAYSLQAEYVRDGYLGATEAWQVERRDHMGHMSSDPNSDSCCSVVEERYRRFHGGEGRVTLIVSEGPVWGRTLTSANKELPRIWRILRPALDECGRAGETHVLGFR